MYRNQGIILTDEELTYIEIMTGCLNREAREKSLSYCNNQNSDPVKFVKKMHADHDPYNSISQKTYLKILDERLSRGLKQYKVEKEG